MMHTQKEIVLIVLLSYFMPLVLILFNFPEKATPSFLFEFSVMFLLVWTCMLLLYCGLCLFSQKTFKKNVS